MKEMIRKFLVSLKKNPQAIPLLAHTVAFGIFSLNLTAVSNTTAKVYGAHMGLCSFVTMLLSILAYVCLFSAYPKRKKPNWIMIAMVLIMYAIVIFADSFYAERVWAAVKRTESPIVINDTTMYIKKAYDLMNSTHITATIISAVLIVTEPIYAMLLKKINTSVEIEDNGNLDAIELSDEE